MDIRRRLIDCRLRVRYAGVLLALIALAVWMHPPDALGGDFTRGLLWRIEAADAEPSYLFGTIHSEDARVLALAPPVRQAFDGAHRICLEITLDAATLVTTSLAMMLTDGRTLKDIVGDDLYQKTVAALADYAVPEMVTAQLKPWAAATTLIMPKPVTGVVLDTAFYRDGVAAGKPVEGLETVAEQLQVFENVEERHQVTLLRDTVEHLPEVRADYEALLAAWLDRDLDRLVAIGDASLQRTDDDFFKSFKRTLIVDRNHRMDERMQPYLKTGGAFIAVGALHLPGKEGLLNLLEKRGYKVVRVW